MKDINKKTIRENDIVKFRNDYGGCSYHDPSEVNYDIGLVIKEKGRLYIDTTKSEWNRTKQVELLSVVVQEYDELEIIGTKQENPELLK